MAAARISMKVTIVLVVLTSCLMLLVAPSVYAKTVAVQGRVESAETSAAGSSIIFTNTLSKQVTSTVFVSATGIYNTFIPQGVYDITLVPPSKSGLTKTTTYHQQIIADANVDISVPSSKQNSTLQQRGKLHTYLGIIIVIVLLITTGYFLWKKKA